MSRRVGIILSGTLSEDYFEGTVLFNSFLNPGNYAQEEDVSGYVGGAVEVFGADFYPCGDGDVYIRDIYRDSLTKR